MMQLDELTTEVEAAQSDARRFEVEPSEMYPAALDDLRREADSSWFVSTARETYKQQAAQLPEEAWELALVPRGEVSSHAALVVRSQALELARLWFTECLHQHIDYAPLELRILGDADWRL